MLLRHESRKAIRRGLILMASLLGLNVAMAGLSWMGWIGESTLKWMVVIVGYVGLIVGIVLLLAIR
jgi:hypothetical protein